MIRLRILGPVELEPPALDVLHQPKRLALLSYLAISGAHGMVRRDTVLALFWPELPQDRARAALNQALYAIRAVLPPDTITTQGDGLAVTRALLWCDAAEFLRALDQGETARALDLYRDGLLEGLFVSDAPPFERWLEETRASFADRALAATLQLAEETGSTEWARRAVELAPLDEEAGRRLIALLARQGNLSGALQAYRQLAQRLRAQLEVEPSAVTEALVAELRARETSPRPTGKPLLGTGPSLSRRALRPGAIGALLLVGSAIAGRALLSRESASDPRSVNRLLVLPFVLRDSARAGRDSLERDVVELLGSRLDQAGPIRAVPGDSVASALAQAPGGSVESLGELLGRRFAAGSIVEGAITRSGSWLHLSAQWKRSPAPGTIAVASVEGSSAEFLTLLDSLAFRLLAGAEDHPAGQIAHAAVLSAPSLPALAAFLSGEQALHDGRFNAAVHAFELAAADSTFALAQLRLDAASLWASDYSLAAGDLSHRALRHGARLRDRERQELEAYAAWREGNAEWAIALLRGLLAGDPENPEAWFQLGESQFHYNPLRGLPLAASRDAFEEVLRLDPHHFGAQWHLALLEASEERLAALDRRLDALVAGSPETDYRLEIAALRGCAHHDVAALTRLGDSLRSAGDGRLFDLAWRCAVFGRDLRGAEGLARWLLDQRRERHARALGRMVLAQLAAARGRYRESLAQVDSLELLEPALGLEQRTRTVLLPWWPARPAELQRLLEKWSANADTADSRIWGPVVGTELRARLDLALDQPQAALREADRLERLSDQPETQGLTRALARDIRDAAAARTGGIRQLPDWFGSDAPKVWFGWAVTSARYSRPGDRFRQATWLAQQGRDREALSWYGSLEEVSLADLEYAGPARLERARICERLADSEGATRESARLLELWSSADPELQSLVAEARAYQSKSRNQAGAAGRAPGACLAQ